MFAQIHFTGPSQYRIRSTAEVAESILEVSVRRMLKGPHHPGWTWFVELCTQILKAQVNNALAMTSVREARRYLNSVVITSPALEEVSITRVVEKKFKGSWFTSKDAENDVILLYFHGGGYSFYPRPYENVIAMVTHAAGAKTFALDYSLTPEHRFPTQLHEALYAYRWLLSNGVEPDNLVVAGDSAGGNLALALLLAARDSKLPMPAMAVALSPPTDFEADVPDVTPDWIDKPSLLRWADWFCGSAERSDPLVSPLRADLRGLPPIYIQAGRAEILHDSIQTFADRAKARKADVVLESWKDMPHVFQVFGPDVPQSAAALQRIGEVIDSRVRGKRKQPIAAE
jgi:monoterpene epsilon-lactone hydrolase